jgi:CrcB protein
VNIANAVAVAVGGAAGSLARYAVALLMARSATSWFPWGTWLVNVLGCFALELVLALVTGALRVSPAVRLLLTTGFMGGFTTYSTFNSEVSALFRSGAWRLGTAYLALTVLTCLLAGLGGLALGRALAGGPG